MAVKIRLTRRGRKKLALYDVVVADARAPRDGRFIEKIGTYNPNTNPATIVLNEEKAFQWVMNGAQPTDTVKAMLSYRGILYRKHLQIGVVKGAITQEQADTKFNDWKQSKEDKIAGKVDTLAQKKAETAKARLAAEAKVKEARAEAITKKNTPPVEEAIAEVPAEGAQEDAAATE
jgi:small subunit ribosomal protein S16